jgi:hypothetical protein
VNVAYDVGEGVVFLSCQQLQRAVSGLCFVISSPVVCIKSPETGISKKYSFELLEMIKGSLVVV